MIRYIPYLLVIASVNLLYGQALSKLSFNDHFQLSNPREQLYRTAAPSPPIIMLARGDSSPFAREPKTPLLQEVGYVAAQQVVFVGLSYLSSRERGFGPVVAAGFDVFMGTAGALNIPHQNHIVKQAGYVVIASGFFAKSYYTLSLADLYSEKDIFLSSYLVYNALVYFGYLLDTL